MDARQTYGDERKARPVAWASVAAAVVLWSVLPGASGAAGAVPGTKFRDCPGCPEMVVVPEGRFEMGSMSGYERQKSAARGDDCSVPFAVGVNEVPFGEWDACVSGDGCGWDFPDDAGWGRGRRPVINCELE